MKIHGEPEEQMPSHYLVETNVLIHRRLLHTIRVLLIVGIIVMLVSFARAYGLYMHSRNLHDSYFLHQVLSCVLFSPYILIMFYADRLARSHSRLGTQITLLATFTILSIQLLINGTEAVHAMFAFPMILVFTGFFSNTKVLRYTAIAIAVLVTILTLLESIGIKAVNPVSHGYFSPRNLLYISIILLGAYTMIQLMAQDFIDMQSALIIKHQKAEFLANHDTLTGLPNRYYSEQSFGDFFSVIQPDKDGHVLFVDIDNFKIINTRFGHRGGDKALQVIAGRLQQLIDTHQAVVCRIGGDEFIVMLICLPTNIRCIAQELQDIVAEPMVLSSETLRLTCSIGITKFNKGDHFQTLYHQADTAMHRAKYTGKNTIVEHDQAYTDRELRNAKILSCLQQASKLPEYRICYQPQIDLRTGNIIGMEALIRLNLDGEELSPEVFIPIAEQHGLINDLTYWVLQEACKDCKYCHDSGYPDLFVAVNISAVVLERGNLADSVTQTLEQTGLSPHYLELEITESALFQLNGSYGQSQLQRLRQLGINLSIDDFGTGYSNLHYLGELDIQTLKIDKSFVMQLHTTKKNRDIVLAILDIAKRFELRIVAEGVETEESALALTNMNCDIGQGYYWSKAVPIDQLIKLLAQNQKPPLILMRGQNRISKTQLTEATQPVCHPQN